MRKMTTHENVLLAPYTTLKVGGPAEYFVEVKTIEELMWAVDWAQERSLPITVLGEGSNVLIPDEGLRGLVIKNAINVFRTHVHRDGSVSVVIGAGVNFDAFIAEMVVRGWWGLENLSAIPGCVGATPIQNVGAYGVEVKDLIKWVEVYDPHAKKKYLLQNDMCAFGYRDSFFKTKDGKHLIVTRVAFTLSTQPHPIITYRDLHTWFADKEGAPTLEEIRAAVMHIRSKKFPDWHEVGTAGSFFKNPILTQKKYDELKAQYPELPGYPTDHGEVKVPLAWILDYILGLKGKKEGAVGTYKGQALVITHEGGASSADIVQYAQDIADRVHDAVGITVEWEVTMLG